MTTYNGDIALKQKHLDMVQSHLDRDTLAQGWYVLVQEPTIKGCSVGCLAYELKPNNSNYHYVVAEGFHLPLWLIYMQDVIFEGLTREQSKKFHLNLVKAIPVGEDITSVLYGTMLYRFTRLLQLQLRFKHHEKMNAVFALSAAIECMEKLIQRGVFQPEDTIGKIDRIKRRMHSAPSVRESEVDINCTLASLTSVLNALEFLGDVVAGRREIKTPIRNCIVGAVWSMDQTSRGGIYSGKGFTAERDTLLTLLKELTP